MFFTLSLMSRAQFYNNKHLSDFYIIGPSDNNVENVVYLHKLQLVVKSGFFARMFENKSNLSYFDFSLLEPSVFLIYCDIIKWMYCDSFNLQFPLIEENIFTFLRAVNDLDLICDPKVLFNLFDLVHKDISCLPRVHRYYVEYCRDKVAS